MTSAVQLSEDEQSAIRSEIVFALIKKHAEDIMTFSPGEAAAILGMSIKSFWEIPDLHRIEMSPKNIRYSLKDIREWQAKHRKLPGAA